MLKLFVKYKSVLRFIFVFLGSYLVFTLIYNLYLEFFRSPVYYPDYFTHLVAKQSEALISSFGYNAQILPHQSELSMKLIVNDAYLARIVEGCNAISIIILFASFVLSFFGKLKLTLLYLLAGAVIVYAMNIIRIAILAIGIYEYPEYTDFLHSIIFPLIIYGTVFILWLIWVRIYSRKHNV
ncbi:exosortase family protein XrtF [Salegentibacter mishustinae]|uniref:exosortase family protein XrtF n=1 Tax=Salegentibacter mishustinae TaxID=270918 RepID=UPI0024918BE0|nr:exosortase family protein XrtF [Salegentibacter mishustinae]